MRRIVIDITASESSYIPVQVQNVTAADQITMIQVNWDEYVPPTKYGVVNLYRIERKVNNGTWQLDREFTSEEWVTGFFFWDIDVESGNTYHYRIKAYTDEGFETDWSEIASVENDPLQLPAKPVNVTAVALSATSIKISWENDIYGVQSDLERKKEGGTWQLWKAGLEEQEYIDIDLDADTEYSYRVTAKGVLGDSPVSDIVTESTEALPEEIFNPPSLTTVIVSGGIQVTWTVDSNNTIATTSNQLEKIEDSGSPTFQNLGPASNSALDNVLTEGRTYKYRVRAYNADHGYSAWSDQKTIVYTPATPLNREYDFTFTSAIHGQTGGAYVYIPESYRLNPVAEFPVLVYLHGQGENGGGSAPDFPNLANGSGPTKYLRGTSNEVPVICICPQVVAYQAFSKAGIIDEAVDAVFDNLLTNLDKTKFILSGYSSGGNDSWLYARDLTHTRLKGHIPFACRLNIPQNTTTNIPEYVNREIPTWIFHNNGDGSQTVDPHKYFLANMGEAPHIRGTIYDLSGHDPVTRTLNGIGGPVISGYYPFQSEPTKFWDWIHDVYFDLWPGNEPDPGDPDPGEPEELVREYDFTYPSPAQSVTLGAAYVYIPEAYRLNPVEDFPVVIFCHGQGQRAGGTSPNFSALVGDDGMARYLRGKSTELPYIVICPQVVGWGSFATAGMIDECFQAVIDGLLPNLNPNKFILSGWSSGGNDTWPYVKDPTKNSKVVGFIPFGCRLSIPSGNTQVQDYIDQEIPTWIFHNNADGVQDVSNHLGFLTAVSTLDPTNDFIRGTIYDASGHPVVEKTVSGEGDPVISGYYPYEDAGDELAEWVEAAYFGVV